MTWFKWESYATWLSGFAMLAVVYYRGSDLYLVDRSVLDVSGTGGHPDFDCLAHSRMDHL